MTEPGGRVTRSAEPGRRYTDEEVHRLLERAAARRALGEILERVAEAAAIQYLGRTYEALERPAEARAAYEYFLRWWGEADPELQPLVEEARQALVRIARKLN